MMEWFSGLPGWLKYGLSLALLGVSTLLFFCGILWIWGWVAGGVLLVAAVFFSGDNTM